MLSPRSGRKCNRSWRTCVRIATPERVIRGHSSSPPRQVSLPIPKPPDRTCECLPPRSKRTTLRPAHFWSRHSRPTVGCGNLRSTPAKYQRFGLWSHGCHSQLAHHHRVQHQRQGLSPAQRHRWPRLRRHRPLRGCPRFPHRLRFRPSRCRRLMGNRHSQMSLPPTILAFSRRSKHHRFPKVRLWSIQRSQSHRLPLRPRSLHRSRPPWKGQSSDKMPLHCGPSPQARTMQGNRWMSSTQRGSTTPALRSLRKHSRRRREGNGALSPIATHVGDDRTLTWHDWQYGGKATPPWPLSPGLSRLTPGAITP
jgi:hypothetical protein